MKIIKCVIKVNGMYVGKNFENYVGVPEQAQVFFGKKLAKKYAKELSVLKKVKVEIQEI